MGRRAILILVGLSTGCMARDLRVPATDHYIQMTTIATACEREGYGSGKCTDEDLEAMATQACLIAAIARREDVEGCDGGR